MRSLATALASLLLIAGTTACASAPHTADRAALHSEIVTMFDRAARAWTRGDLDTFMSDYLDSDRTTYVGRAGVVRGRAAIREVYAPRFAPGGVRDSLSFDGIEADLLAPDIAHVVAWYVLARGDSVIARGPTSLLMERVDGRWLIVHDHSS